MRRLGALAGSLALLLGVAVVGAPGASADALAMGRCTTSTNVVLAVNYGHWGGPIVRSCGSLPSTGFQLLNQGGFRTQGTSHDGPAFICRIASSSFHGGAGYPTPRDEACDKTPPADAYWSYWHADAGQNTWTYSQLGAMSYRSKPGSVEYWQFGSTNVAGTKGLPTVTPAQVRATNAASKPASGGGGANAGGANAGGARHSGGSDNGPQAGGNGGGAPAASTTTAAGGSRSSTPTPTASGGRRASTAAASTSSSRGASSSSDTPAVASSGPQIVDARPASATPKATSDSGSVLPLVLVAGLVVVLGGGAGWTALRRRRADAEL